MGQPISIWEPTRIAYQRFCEERFPPVGPEQVAALEDRINVTFPDLYREYLIEFNGGWFTEPLIHPPEDGGEDYPRDLLTYMNGIDASHETAELGTRRSLAIFEDNDPPELVPIGYTVMGYLVVLVTRSQCNDYGMVYLRTFTETFYLADNIAEFFGLLTEP